MPARAKRVVLSTPLLGAAIGVLTWPFGSIRPGVGLDPSWIAGLYMAADRGLDAGTQIVFTYGPLGFLGFPNLYEVWPGRLAFAWSTLVHLAFCVALLWAARRAFGLPVGLVVALCAAVSPEPDPILIAAAVVGAAALLGEWSDGARLRLAAGAGALAGMQLLGSLRAGPTLVVVGIAVLLGLPERRRNFAVFAGSLLAAFFVFWFLTGQGIGNLDEYAVNTASVVGGYSEAMVFLQPGRWWQTPAMAISLLTIAGLTAAAVWNRDNARRVGLAILVLAVSFLLFKHAVVRESPGSAGVFLVSLFALGVALTPHVRRPLAIAAVVLLAGLGWLGTRELVEARFHLRERADVFFSELGTVAIPGRAADERQRGREEMQATYGLDAKELRVLRAGTVHVAPWEAGAAWAYDLDWDPLPVFQQYSAYTQRLDRLNAEKLESPTAPEIVLWQNANVFNPAAINFPGAIDARWPAFESPALMRQMFCRYRMLSWDDVWAVLLRRPDRCGPERHLRTVEVGNLESVRLPPVRRNEIVVARVDGLQVSGIERLRTFLFRAKNRGVLFADASWSIVGNTTPDGLMLLIPPWADYPGKFALSSGSPTIGFERQGGKLTGVDDSTRFTISFSALPVHAPAVLPAPRAADYPAP